MPDEWIVGVVTEFYRREEHIYNRSEVSSVCSFMVRLLLDSCVDPSSETAYFTANKEEMNTGKSKKSRFARIESLVEPFFLYTLVDYKL